MPSSPPPPPPPPPPPRPSRPSRTPGSSPGPQARPQQSQPQPQYQQPAQPQYPPAQPFGAPTQFGSLGQGYSSPGSYEAVPSYGSAPPRTSALAVTALILGILGVIPCVLNSPLALVAIILGAIALSSINRRPTQLGGKGFAISGLVLGIAGVAIVVIMIPLMIPSMSRSREMANRAYCAANLRMIMRSCNVYANDNHDVFPAIGARTDFTGRGTRYNPSSAVGLPSMSSDATITSLYTTSGYSGAPVYQNFWILVLKGYAAPKQFICKSDPNAGMAPAPVTGGSGYPVTFTSDGTSVDLKRMSYSVAYMYTDSGSVGGWWKATVDSSLPLISDMAPLNGEGGTTVTSIGGTAKNYNSRNHNGDGQVVGYSDAHASFERRPDIGANSDNIWTSGGRFGPTSGGTPISSPGMIPQINTNGSPWDTIMVPVRTSTGTVQ